MPVYLSTDPYAGLTNDTPKDPLPSPDYPRDPQGDPNWPDPNRIPQTDPNGTPPQGPSRSSTSTSGPQDPATTPNGTMKPYLGPNMTREQVQAYIRWLYQSKGVALSDQDLNGWTNYFFSPEYKGDWAYWANKLENQNESFGWKSDGGFGPNSNLWNKVPTLEEAMNMPGLQFAIDRAKNAISASASAKGVLNTGGTLKDIVDYTVPVALQGYSSLAGLQFNANNANYSNLYGLANLGMNASSYSNKYGSGNA